MARKTVPIAPSVLEDDDISLVGIQSLPDYRPANPLYSVEHMVEVRSRLLEARQQRQSLEFSLTEVRATEALLTHEYHDLLVGGRSSVSSQYGRDSIEVEKVGLTRASNRKRPARRRSEEA